MFFSVQFQTSETPTSLLLPVIKSLMLWPKHLVINSLVRANSYMYITGRVMQSLYIIPSTIYKQLQIHSLGEPSTATVFFSNVFFITISYPLHVSAHTGHLQIEYVLVNS
jgi:hypothetical protein